jgi:hypothetical protein
MHTRSSDIKRKGCVPPLLVLLTMIMALPCLAQKVDRLPDSLSTSIDSLSPENTTIGTVEPPGSGVTSSDASVSASAATDSSSASSSGSGSSDQPAATAEAPTLRQIPDSSIAHLKKDKDFSYANDPAWWAREGTRPGKGDKGNENNDDSFWDRLAGNGAFRLIFYLLLGGLLSFALYKIIAGNNLHLFYRAPLRIPDGKDPDDGTDLNEEDLERKIREALRSGDHRTGIRWLFLKSLRLLNDKRLIVYHPQGTNQEYIGQLGSLPPGKNFLFLANAYEYIWYGDFPLNEEQYGLVEQKFQDFYKEINTR